MSSRLFKILICIIAAALGIIMWILIGISTTSRHERSALESRLAKVERKVGMPVPEAGSIEFVPGEDDHEAAAMRRIAKLNKRVRKMEDEIAALRREIDAGPKGNESSIDSDMSALLESVEGGKGAAGDLPFTPEQLKTVRALLDQVRKEDRERRIANFANNVKLRMRDEYMKWKEDLRLTPEQEREVDEFLDETLKRAVVAWDSYLENGDIESLRKELREVRKSVDDKAHGVLDAWQVDKLKELDPRGFGARNKDR